MNTVPTSGWRARALLGSVVALVAVTVAQAQVYRSIDGLGNNVAHPSWGAAGEELVRWAAPCYADSISAPAGPSRVGPREVSNAFFDQGAPLADAMGLSDFCWVFGQFLDHDITLTLDGPELSLIPVPTGDPDFDPFRSGGAVIPMHRSLAVPGTGTSTANPREHANALSAFIDGSNVYGSDVLTSRWLRTFRDGKLKTSAGGMLPYNTIDGSATAFIDPSAPHMDNPVGLTDRFFVAGDARANENPLLLTMHTLFVREHNRLCDVLARRDPSFTDEQLYQRARKLNGAILQAIVYNEWLPAMGLRLPPYTGYDPTVNPGIANAFAAAAFRMGHTLLNGQIRRLNPDGSVHADGHLTLRDAFFNPGLLPATGGIDPFVKGMAAQTQQPFDARMLDDVRNFLFGPPGAGGLDLAAININRGRERGIADYNGLRVALGLPAIADWSEAIGEPAVLATARATYPDVDDADAWVGMLAETAMPNRLFGPTVSAALERQFAALRDGDRYFYLADPALTPEDCAVIGGTRLSDVIRRNTDVTVMQGNVFTSTPHSAVPTCTAGAAQADLDVVVRTRDGAPLPGATVRVYGMDDVMPQAPTTAGGLASFASLPTCDDYAVDAAVSSGLTAGVTSYDLYLIARHVLGTEPLTDPLAVLAADVNQSGNLSAFDITTIRRAILGLDPDFRGGPSWRTIDPRFAPATGTDPLAYAWKAKAHLPLFAGLAAPVELTAVKMGDVDASYAAASAPDAPAVAPRAAQALRAQLTGNRLRLLLSGSGTLAAQFELRLAPNVELLAVEGLAEGEYRVAGNRVRVVLAEADRGADERTVELVLAEATSDAGLQLSDGFENTAFSEGGVAHPIRLTVDIEESDATVADATAIVPNPIRASGAVVRVDRDAAAGARTVRLRDVLGRLVYAATFEGDRHEIGAEALRGVAAGALTWSVEIAGQRHQSGILTLVR